jgi:chromate transporter
MRVLEIFWLCFRTSVISFAGIYGALPEYLRLFTIQRDWLSSEQVIQDYVVAQAMPGPNMVLAVMIGYRAAGTAGAAAAFTGTYMPPMLIMSCSVALLERYRRLRWVRHAELALRPVVVGLMLAAVASILREQALRYGVLATAVVGLAVAAVVTRRARVNPLLLLFAAGALFAVISSFDDRAHSGH